MQIPLFRILSVVCALPGRISLTKPIRRNPLNLLNPLNPIQSTRPYSPGRIVAPSPDQYTYKPMLYSMTGFGRAEGFAGSRAVVAELRCLNGKGFDLNTARLPAALRPYEVALRSMMAKLLVRGTADVSLSIRTEGAARPLSINMALAESYYRSIMELAGRLDLPGTDLLPTLLRMPEIIAPESEALSEEEWTAVQKVLLEAAERLIAHRRNEGAALQADLLARMDAIEAAVAGIEPLEGARILRLRERLQASLAALGAESKDPNRFEQELIYYIEKMDISEEKTRLTQHIGYFRETVLNGETSKGKVLGFILQEIGREINTLGSKANDAPIQKIVVGMKDELEKAKEQVLNVL